MKLYELVNSYHIGTELSCAEAMFKACDEYYELNLTEESRKMFSIMGMGMQSELSCCGAFTVAMGIIGLFTAETGMTDCDNIEGYNLVNDLTNDFIQEFSNIQCTGLKELEIQGFENPCHSIVETLAKKLEQLIPKETIINKQVA
ncbi:MAG: C-GCAxxG-C-C family (seleno)protein [Coprobacillus sp.]